LGGGENEKQETRIQRERVPGSTPTANILVYWGRKKKERKKEIGGGGGGRGCYHSQK